MKIEKWVQDSAGRLDAVVLLDAGEKPSTVQVLEFVDRQAGAEKIWLLGRATLQRKENRVLVGPVCYLLWSCRSWKVAQPSTV